MRTTTCAILWLVLVALSAGPARGGVQELLDAAVADGAGTVTLPDGRIELDGRLTLRNADGLVVDGNGTTLVFSDRGGVGWSITSCRRLTLRGFTIDYDPLPFIQGRITARAADGKRYDFTVSEGYPGLRAEDAQHYRQGYVFEPDRRRWKPWVPDLYARRVEIVDARRGRFVMGYAPYQHERIAVGDRIVLTLRTAPAMRMNDCQDVRIEDVTFLAAPGAAYLGRYMRGDNYYRYTIRPGPPPAGAREPRLISTCADGLNIAFATKGPTLERCRFSFMGDDSVNLHGAVLLVLDSPAPTELLVAWPYSPEWLATVIPAGSTVRRLRPGDYRALDTAKLKAFRPVGPLSPPQVEAVQTVWPRNRKGRGTVFRLTLAAPLPARAGEFLDIPASNAPGFAIRDCVFSDHRARGLRIMASRGVIERNTFRRIKMNAVTLGAEYAFWREAGWVDDVTVRHNTIEDVGRDAWVQGPRCYCLGAIATFCRTDRPRGREPIQPWPGNRNITIEHNLIRDCPTAGIFTAAARDVRIRHNRLERCFTDPGEAPGRAYGLDVRAPIDVRHAEGAEVSANETADCGPSRTPPKSD